MWGATGVCIRTDIVFDSYDLTSLPFNGLLTLFADDTSLFYFGNEHENIAQLCEDLKLLESWCNWTKLILNPSKTNYVLFCKPAYQEIHFRDNICIHNKPIEKLDSVTFLGLHLDKNLTWQPHIDSIIKKIRPIIAILPRRKNVLPSKLKRSFYFSMLHSRLTYLNIVWGSCARYRLHDLLTLQK